MVAFINDDLAIFYYQFIHRTLIYQTLDHRYIN